MAEYESERLGVKFELPDKLTIAQQLSFRSALFLSRDKDKFRRFWDGAVELIVPESWKCEIIPDFKTLDLDVETDGRMVDIVHFVGTTTAGHLAAIGAVPKNA